MVFTWEMVLMAGWEWGRVQPSVPQCYSSSTLMILKDFGHTNSITAQGIRFLNKGISPAEIAVATYPLWSCLDSTSSYKLEWRMKCVPSVLSPQTQILYLRHKIPFSVLVFDVKGLWSYNYSRSQLCCEIEPFSSPNLLVVWVAFYLHTLQLSRCVCQSQRYLLSLAKGLLHNIKNSVSRVIWTVFTTPCGR